MQGPYAYCTGKVLLRRFFSEVTRIRNEFLRNVEA